MQVHDFRTYYFADYKMEIVGNHTEGEVDNTQDIHSHSLDTHMVVVDYSMVVVDYTVVVGVVMLAAEPLLTLL